MVWKLRFCLSLYHRCAGLVQSKSVVFEITLLRLCLKGDSDVFYKLFRVVKSMKSFFTKKKPWCFDSSSDSPNNFLRTDFLHFILYENEKIFGFLLGVLANSD